MIKLYINNIETIVPENSSVLQACDSLGIEIPRFCFHERLDVSGNCRMCLVEIEKTPKPVASCAYPVMNNMRVFTDTPLVKKARENVLEFLLVNHPLDCPICDQGGECDLQDQAMFFGSDTSRWNGPKRGVEDKDFSPLIKSIMTRCIHCTRCVRFAQEIAGIGDLGTTNRGRETEVGSYVKKILQSELSGNVIDLCPVGALTSKPSAFVARPWELKSIKTIDLSDGIGSNVRVDFKETEIVRILPLEKEDINEEWISDKTRFNYDFAKQRLDRPYLKKQGTLMECSWKEAVEEFSSLISKTEPSKISIFCSVNTSLETLGKVKELSGTLGIKNVGYPRDFNFNLDFSENFLSNTPISRIADSDFCLLIGINPRYEASMLNLKLKKRVRQGAFQVANIGVSHDLTYETKSLGLSPCVLLQISEGKHPLAKDLRKSKTPIVFCGANLGERKDYDGIKEMITYIAKETKLVNTNWNGFCFLNQESNQAGAFELGLKGNNITNLKDQEICLIVGPFREEELNDLKENISQATKFITISASAFDFIANADIILPSTTHLEKELLYLNLEGRAQKTQKATTPPSLARGESYILQILEKKTNPEKENNSFNRYSIEEQTPRSTKTTGILKSLNTLESKPKTVFSISRSPLTPFLTNFYKDAFSSFSYTMFECSRAYKKMFSNFSTKNTLKD